MKKLLRFLFTMGLLLIFIGGIVLFTTPFGYQTRLTLAEMILSSQHRQWAKYTFLPDKDINRILQNIEHPKYENSVTDKSNIGQKKVAKRNPKELVISVDDIERHYSPTYYYKGKIVEISNPNDVHLVSSKLRNHGEQIFVIAERAHALAAINASGFVDVNGHGNGGSATGVVIENGEIKSDSPDNKDFVAALTQDGDMITGKYSANELINLGVRDAAGFKPQLIVNGKKMVEGDGGWGIGPRTAIGQTADGTIIMVIIDGRQPGRSIGATIEEVQEIMYSRGAVQAMCMDGGSSSSLYFNGKNVTIPSSVGHIPRYLPNIWAVIPQESQKVKMYENGRLIKSGD